MRFRPLMTSAALAWAGLFASPGSGAAAPSACAPVDPGPVAGTIQAMYTALAAGDAKTARAFMAPDFYIFDGGARFDTDGILGLIRKTQQAGATYRWQVTEPRAQIACDIAWITYVNRGGVAKAGQETPMTWLESGVLRWEAGRWVIEFMHSTRQPPGAAAR